MSLVLLMANVDRAVDHGVVVIAVAVIAAAGGLVYGLRRVLATGRASRTRCNRDRDNRKVDL